MRLLSRIGSFVAAGVIAGCEPHAAGPPPPCCAAPGYSRAQVETVLGKPAPPQSSRWHPLPSPAPNAPIYTTEHGYLTVTYAGAHGLATRFSLDFFEGKAPDDAFAIVGAYLPPDARDTGTRVSGVRESIRVFKSERLAREFPATGGRFYLECAGPQPARLCEKADVALGSP